MCNILCCFFWNISVFYTIVCVRIFHNYILLSTYKLPYKTKTRINTKFVYNICWMNMQFSTLWIYLTIQYEKLLNTILSHYIHCIRFKRNSSLLITIHIVRVFQRRATLLRKPKLENNITCTSCWQRLLGYFNRWKSRLKKKWIGMNWIW